MEGYTQQREMPFSNSALPVVSLSKLIVTWEKGRWVRDYYRRVGFASTKSIPHYSLGMFPYSAVSLCSGLYAGYTQEGSSVDSIGPSGLQ